METDSRPLMQTAEVASALGVSGETVRRLARDGRLPPARVDANGYRYWAPETVEAYQSAPAPAPAPKPKPPRMPKPKPAPPTPADDDGDDLIGGWGSLLSLARNALAQGAQISGSEANQWAAVLERCEKSAVSRGDYVPATKVERAMHQGSEAVMLALAPASLATAYGWDEAALETLRKRVYDQVLAAWRIELGAP